MTECKDNNSNSLFFFLKPHWDKNRFRKLKCIIIVLILIIEVVLPPS